MKVERYTLGLSKGDLEHFVEMMALEVNIIIRTLTTNELIDNKNTMIDFVVA